MNLKKIFAAALLLLFSLAVAACGAEPAADKASSQPSSVATGKKSLVVYFSRADENTGGVGYIEMGNTRILAEMIAAKTDADIFEIRPMKPYPKEYTPATEVAKQEKEENSRPEITGELPDLSKYDTV
ncbi:MAG: flavodoxin, partial [Selenomonadaceae bacterium]|nr:flavodoxin [Selenomonadaceae bacterium]